MEELSIDACKVANLTQVNGSRFITRHRKGGRYHISIKNATYFEGPVEADVYCILKICKGKWKSQDPERILVQYYKF